MKVGIPPGPGKALAPGPRPAPPIGPPSPLCMKIRAANARLVDRHDWTDGLATFTVAPDGWELPPHKPGQFANLALPEGDDWDQETGASIRRAYSIASGPGRGTLDFYVRRVDGGALTPKLFNLPLGAGIHLDERIAGHFTLDGARDAEDLVLVGTGTGVAPYRPMIQDRDLRSRFGRVILLYSDRRPEDLGYHDEFRALAQEDDRFLFLPTLTGKDVDAGWDGLRGRVQHHLEPEAYERLTGAPLHKDRVQVFLCGNPQMIVEVQGRLEELGMKRHRKREPGEIHMEKYW